MVVYDHGKKVGLMLLLGLKNHTFWPILPYCVWGGVGLPHGSLVGLIPIPTLGKTWVGQIVQYGI